MTCFHRWYAVLPPHERTIALLNNQPTEPIVIAELSNLLTLVTLYKTGENTTIKIDYKDVNYIRDWIIGQDELERNDPYRQLSKLSNVLRLITKHLDDGMDVYMEFSWDNP